MPYNNYDRPCWCIPAGAGAFRWVLAPPPHYPLLITPDGLVAGRCLPIAEKLPQHVSWTCWLIGFPLPHNLVRPVTTVDVNLLNVPRCCAKRHYAVWTGLPNVLPLNSCLRQIDVPIVCHYQFYPDALCHFWTSVLWCIRLPSFGQLVMQLLKRQPGTAFGWRCGRLTVVARRKTLTFTPLFTFASSWRRDPGCQQRRPVTHILPRTQLARLWFIATFGVPCYYRFFIPLPPPVPSA